MNNFIQKNKKLETKPLNNIAYANYDNIKIPYTALQNIPELYDADINNAFQQLVDNDMYLKKTLEKNQNYKSGPINVDPDSEDNLKSLPNNSKILTDDGTSLKFRTKINSTIQSSIKEQKTGLTPNWIDIFDGAYFIGCSDRVLTCQTSQHISESNNFIPAGSTCYTIYNNHLIIGNNNQIIYVENKSDTHNIPIDGNVKYIYENSYQSSQINTIDSTYCITDSDKILSGQINTDDFNYSYNTLTPNITLVDGEHLVAIACLQRTGGYKILNGLTIDQSDINDSNNILLATNKHFYILTSIDNLNLNFRLVEDVNNIKKIIQINNNDFLITTSDGILYRYTYYDSENEYFCQVNDDEKEPIFNIKQIENLQGDKYIAVAKNNTLKTTKNLRIWNQILELNSVLTDINDICYKSSESIIILSNNKIFETILDYTLSEPIKQFTVDDAFDYFESDDIQNMINTQLNNKMTSHISKDHAIDSFVTLLNEEYMSPDFSNLCTFTSTNVDSHPSQQLSSAVNDFIENVQFINTGSTDDIHVLVNNFTTGYKDVEITCDCIAKLWKSGLNELYINIPTTHTYYIAHLPGTPMCDIDPTKPFKRQNLRTLEIQDPSINTEISSSLSGYYTNIKINILSTQFEIQNLLGLQINGTSLPLKMYKDTNNQDGSTQVNFHSFIEPSMILNDVNTESTNNEYYTISACCFGTDEQSFKISYITPTTYYYNGKNIHTVTFYGNGEKTLNGKGSYIQKYRDIGTGIENKPIRSSQFNVGTNKYLLGWSIKSTASQIDYHESDRLSLADFHGSKNLDLYAVWRNIDWNNCTSFKLNINNNNAVVIANGRKIPNVDDIVIDFGD